MSLSIQFESEDSPHPHCPHGPTLLFSRPGDGNEYYACAAQRDQKTCSFKLAASQLTATHLAKRYGNDKVTALRSLRQQFRESPAEERNYCFDCDKPVFGDELKKHVRHKMLYGLRLEYMHNPTLFLKPLDNDTSNAQYFFDDKALDFFTNACQHLSITKVVCMGAPRLHCHLRSTTPKIRSYLLDLDQRFYCFCDDEEFAWHNMCNNHFFDKAQEAEFKRFLQGDPDERVLLFTDPPFGCRTEPIAQSLRQLMRLHSSVNARPYQPLAVFWVFPYYAAAHVTHEMPELQLCDYKVQYTNHDSYTKARKLGSPVRLYTNVPLDALPLPTVEQYKYCAPCRRYTAVENRHCALCRRCTSVNGASYRHCASCATCVKPSYVHCVRCRRCVQQEQHDCARYVAHQRCWICRALGHKERDCRQWLAYAKRKSLPIVKQTAANIRCMLCLGRKHNELQCSKRSEHLLENEFLMDSTVLFKD